MSGNDSADETRLPPSEKVTLAREALGRRRWACAEG